MSQITNILKTLEGTAVHDVLVNIEDAYERIKSEQTEWYGKTCFTCPEGCGKCCVGFEPDIFEGEALYMAAWLLENQHETALAIMEGNFPFDNGAKTCPLFNAESPYHCSIYGGRAFICRLFGASSFRSQNGEKMWRPCTFYPDEKLAAHKPPLEKRPYNEEGLQRALNDLNGTVALLILIVVTELEVALHLVEVLLIADTVTESHVLHGSGHGEHRHKDKLLAILLERLAQFLRGKGNLRIYHRLTKIQNRTH